MWRNQEMKKFGFMLIALFIIVFPVFGATKHAKHQKKIKNAQTQHKKRTTVATTPTPTTVVAPVVTYSKPNWATNLDFKVRPSRSFTLPATNGSEYRNASRVFGAGVETLDRFELSTGGRQVARNVRLQEIASDAPVLEVFKTLGPPSSLALTGSQMVQFTAGHQSEFGTCPTFFLVKGDGGKLFVADVHHTSKGVKLLGMGAENYTVWFSGCPRRIIVGQ